MSPANPAPRTDDLLAQNGAFLRRLAGDLTRCEADAEDLVQDTWTEALTRPPRDGSSPRGWLTRVAQRLAGRKRRGESRRTRREMQAARTESYLADHDLSLVLGELSQALATLEPELRRIVIARYFEGLELKAIAAQEGLGLTTVKARLTRAHDLLRQELDAKGDRQRWLRALAPLALAQAPAPPVTAPEPTSLTSLPTAVLGALAMTTTAKTVAVVVVSGVVLLGLGSLRHFKGLAPTPTAPEQVVVELEQDPQLKPVAQEARIQVATTQQAEQEDTAEAQPSVPESSLTVTITDLFGVPAQGVQVYGAPPGLPLNSFGSTDGEGSVVMRWFAEQPTEMVIGVRAHGRWLGGLRRFHVSPGGSQKLAIAAHTDLLPDDGGLLSLGQIGYSVAVLQAAELDLRIVLLEGMEDLEPREPEQPRRPTVTRPSPTGLPQEGLVRFSATGEGPSHSVGGHVVQSLWNFDDPQVLGGGESVEAAKGLLEGSLTDDIGNPLAAVDVMLRPTDFGVGLLAMPGTRRTKEDGTFQFNADPGGYELRIPSKGEPHIEASINIASGGTVTWQGSLELGTSLRGRAQRPEDFRHRVEDPAERIASATVQTGDGLWIGVTKLDEEGHFWIPNCPSTYVDVDIVLADGGLPLLSQEGVEAGQADWQGTVDLSNQLEVTYTPLDEDQGFAAAAEVRIWNSSGRRGWSGNVGGRRGEEASITLPQGLWSLEVRPQGLCKVTPVTVYAEGDQPIALGPIPMEPVGWLELPRGPKERSWSVNRESDQVNVFAGQFPESSEHEWLSIPLPPGTYSVSVTPEADARPTTEVLELGVGQHVRASAPVQ